jgi:hypothetical protein
MCTKRAAVVALVLLLSVVVGAKPVPLGTVSSCNLASIHGTNLVPGTTIFNGDTIDVGAQGHVWLAVQGGGQVQVFENSTVRLTKSSDSIQLTVDRGRAQTNSKRVVISRESAVGGLFLERARSDQNRHEDRDCAVSKDARKHRTCRDDTD